MAASLRRYTVAIRLKSPGLSSRSSLCGTVHGNSASDCHIQKDSPSASAIEVVAIGHQFWWEYRYPD